MDKVIADLQKAGQCLYLEVSGPIADDVRDKIRAAVDLHAEQRATITAQAEEIQRLKDMLLADPLQMTTPIGLLPINSTGMRALVDYAVGLKARGVTHSEHGPRLDTCAQVAEAR